MLPLAGRKKITRVRVASFETMQVLYGVISETKEIDGVSRKLAMSCIEICMGGAPTIPGVWPMKTLGVGRAEGAFLPKNFYELELPGGDPDGEIPAPRLDDEEESMYSRVHRHEKNRNKKPLRAALSRLGARADVRKAEDTRHAGAPGGEGPAERDQLPGSSHRKNRKGK